MEQGHIEKDKQGRPVMIVEISNEEIINLKKAITSHPKFIAEDSDVEGRRFRTLAGKEDWNRLTQMNISDLKEAVNKYIQDHEGEDNTDMNALNTALNSFRKTLVYV